MNRKVEGVRLVQVHISIIYPSFPFMQPIVSMF